MTWDKDDPRWTAYVLGELDGDDLTALQAQLDTDEDARRYVESLREATSVLSDELRDAAPLALTDLQRRRIENAATTPRATRTRWIAVTATVAACAAALIAVALWPDEDTQPRHESLRMVASEDRSARDTQLRHEMDQLAREQEQLAKALDEAAVEAEREQIRRKLLAKRRQLDKVRRQRDRSREYRHSTEREKIKVRCDPSDPLCGIGGGTNTAAPRAPSRALNMWRSVGGGQPGDNARVVADGDTAAGLPPVEHNTEAYDAVDTNDFVRVKDDALSTFSIDVDTASYANVRRYLTQGMLPPKGAVRIEEMINYFSYDYAEDGDPFTARADVAEAPWNREHRLLRIGIKGKEVVGDRRPRANLVFLIDVSGSMKSANKLPLLKRAMRMLVQRLDKEDQVAIVVYAGASGLVLPSTSASKGSAIESALEQLSSGGSTNGGAGIELAYQTAVGHFIEGGVNRVILATDGDFNVGTTNQSELIELIEEKARSGVYLTVLGFGMGNYKDSTLEKLADKGNGNYAYIDTINEARKVLVQDVHGTLVTIAKDVKIQIEFNPAQVASYRLIGYENRVLAHQDFNDDTKDAGEIGAGHTVTALYEIVPAGRAVKGASKVDDLKYQAGRMLTADAQTDELLTIKLRFKAPDGDTSTKREFVVRDRGERLADANADFRFAAAVAAFGMILRDSEHKGSATWKMVLDLAEDSLGKDPFGYRLEFVSLVKRAQKLQRR